MTGPLVSSAAIRLEPSPASSLEGTWANWAREMSVGDRMGPGLTAWGVPTLELLAACVW